MSVTSGDGLADPASDFAGVRHLPENFLMHLRKVFASRVPTAHDHLARLYAERPPAGRTRPARLRRALPVSSMISLGWWRARRVSTGAFSMNRRSDREEPTLI